MIRNIFIALTLGGAVAASCSFNPGAPGGSSIIAPTGGTAASSGSGSAASSGGGASSGTAASSGTGASAPPPTADGHNCGLQQYGLQNVPPDLLIVLDKSGSMANDQTDTPCARGVACQSKWADMTAGINMVVAQTDTTIRWGLKYFSTDGNCGVAAGAAVPIAANNAAAIAGSIMMSMPKGNTPTAAAVASGATYLMSLTDPNPKYILLATDGEPNCGAGARKTGDSDAAGAEAAVTMAAAAGIPVFVVGVGNVDSAHMTLNALATNGGRPQTGDPAFYPVTNTADLVSVLTKIGGQIASCSFSLGKAPPDPTNIAVYADGVRLAQSMTNGWEYGAGMTSVELYGAACDNVKSKATKDVQAVFGCPGVVIP
ncbi:MAG TPA: vWA domain-containing protein [Polyangia bacterium]|nr:vWA domain-containing protein [Polyangia bacterium]